MCLLKVPVQKPGLIARPLARHPPAVEAWGGHGPTQSIARSGFPHCELDGAYGVVQILGQYNLRGILRRKTGE